MPRHRKKKAASHKGKRRIGKMSMSTKARTVNPLHLLGGVFIGNLGAAFVNLKVLPTVSGTIVGGVAAAGGLAAALMSKSGVVIGMGAGAFGYGATAILQGTGALSGMGCPSDTDLTVWSGGKRVAGMPMQRRISGRAPAGSFPNPAGIVGRAPASMFPNPAAVGGRAPASMFPNPASVGTSRYMRRMAVADAGSR